MLIAIYLNTPTAPATRTATPTPTPTPTLQCGRQLLSSPSTISLPTLESSALMPWSPSESPVSLSNLSIYLPNHHYPHLTPQTLPPNRHPHPHPLMSPKTLTPGVPTDCSSAKPTRPAWFATCLSEGACIQVAIQAPSVSALVLQPSTLGTNVTAGDQIWALTQAGGPMSSPHVPASLCSLTGLRVEPRGVRRVRLVHRPHQPPRLREACCTSAELRRLLCSS